MGDLLSKTLDGRRWNILEDVTGEDLQAVGGEVGADHSVACLASLLGLIIEGEANLLHIRSEKGERLAEVTKQASLGNEDNTSPALGGKGSRKLCRTG